MNMLISRIHSIQDIEWVKKLSKYVFILAVIIEVLIVIVDKSQLMNPLEGRLFQITFALCTLKVILTKYDFKEYIIILLLCTFGLWVDIAGNRNEILRMIMFAVACKDIDIKKSLKYVLWLTVAGCGLLAILSIIGFFGELTVPKEYVGGIFADRYCFGMGNANAFHIMFFAITLLAMYVYAESFKWWGYLLILGINIGVYFLTACKTGLAMVMMSVLGMVMVRYVKAERFRKTIGVFCLILQPILVLISVYFAYISEFLYRYSWGEWGLVHTMPILLFKKIDTLLTGRIISLCNDTANSGSLSSWTWFPNPNNQAYFDLGLVRVFYWYGIVAAVIVLVLFYMASIYFFRKKKMEELLFITIIAIFTLAEAHFVSVYIGRNYALFLVGGVWHEMIRNSLRCKIIQT